MQLEVRASTPEMSLRALTRNTCLQLSSLDVTGDQSGQLKILIFIFILFFFNKSGYLLVAGCLTQGLRKKIVITCKDCSSFPVMVLKQYMTMSSPTQ